MSTNASSPRMMLRVSTDAPREHVIVQLDMDSEPLGYINLDAVAAAHHIDLMAEHRANLADQVPQELEYGARLLALPDPRWQVMPTDQGVALALRHPGLGWLTFLLPPDQAQALSKALLSTDRQAEARG